MHVIHEEGPVKIYPDFDPINPRTDFDHTSTLYAKGLCEEDDGSGPPADTIWLPVYRYSHGNIALRTTPFSCPWDSGLTGYIYESKSSVRDEFGVKRISPKLRALIEDRLRTEVAVFGAYCNGDVFGYENEETGDSCWGFYGFMELDWDYMLASARGLS